MRFISGFCLAFLAVAAGFDFDPREFLISAQSSPQVINLDTEDTDSLVYTLPPSLGANSATDLLADANALSAKTDALLEQIKQLSDHFLNYDNSTNSDLALLGNLTERINIARDTLKSAGDRLGPIQTRQSQNLFALGQIQQVLTCLAESNCSTGFDCSNPAATTRTVSAPGQSGQWVFSNPKKFDCSLNLVSSVSSGFWVNLTLSNFVASEDGGKLEILQGNNTKTDLTANGTVLGISTFPVEITASGEVQFTLSYATYNPCDNYDCGNGICIVKSDNSLGCKCSGCYSLGDDGTCSKQQDDPCDTYGAACNATTPLGNCTTDDSCQYYCVCPGVSSTCTTNKWCDGTSTCQPPRKFGAVQPQKKWWYWF